MVFTPLGIFFRRHYDSGVSTPPLRKASRLMLVTIQYCVV